MPSGSRAQPIFKTALILSLAVHAAALAGFQKAFPFFLGSETARYYHLELIRPPVNGLERAHSEQQGEARMHEETPADSEESFEDTISLNTTDQRYVDYADLIKGRLLEHWTYPPEARAKLMEGRLLLVFSLSRDGVTKSVNILDSSGREILDSEAVRAVRSASPFPPFPNHIEVQRLNIRAVFDYRLTSG